MLKEYPEPKTLWERNQEVKRLRRELLALCYHQTRIENPEYTLLSPDGPALYRDAIEKVTARLETLAKMRFNERNEVRNG